MIRVLHVIGSLNNGGSQAMIMNIYRNINREKIQFDFIIDREDEVFFADEIKQLGGKIYVMPIFNLRNLFKFIKEWNKFFCEHEEYKIIHGHVRSTAAIYLKIAKKYGLETISHSHSTSSGTGIKALIKDIMQYPIRYIADYFFACSKDAGQWLFGKKVIEKENFYIIKNAIDAKKYIYNDDIRIKIRKEFNIEDKFVIGHIGRFSTPKNHSYLIDIFKEIYEENKNSILMLVGDGELRKCIEEKVAKLNLQDNVIFTGIRSDINYILQGMDVFVCPSLFEGLGIVVIEAQATGLHCLVADTLPKLETKVTDLIQYLPLDNNIRGWSRNLLKYNNNYERTNRYKDIENSGYDINSTVKEIERFYNGLVVR